MIGWGVAVAARRKPEGLDGEGQIIFEGVEDQQPVVGELLNTLCVVTGCKLIIRNFKIVPKWVTRVSIFNLKNGQNAYMYLHKSVQIQKKKKNCQANLKISLCECLANITLYNLIPHNNQVFRPKRNLKFFLILKTNLCEYVIHLRTEHFYLKTWNFRTRLSSSMETFFESNRLSQQSPVFSLDLWTMTITESFNT